MTTPHHAGSEAPEQLTMKAEPKYASLVLFFSREQITPRHMPVHVSVPSGLEIVGYIRAYVADADEQEALDNASPLRGESVLNSVPLEP